MFTTYPSLFHSAVDLFLPLTCCVCCGAGASLLWLKAGAGAAHKMGRPGAEAALAALVFFKLKFIYIPHLLPNDSQEGCPALGPGSSRGAAARGQQLLPAASAARPSLRGHGPGAPDTGRQAAIACGSCCRVRFSDAAYNYNSPKIPTCCVPVLIFPPII